jgi:Raf kinase inhibitor-like YbhB/YbcL family protein
VRRGDQGGPGRLSRPLALLAAASLLLSGCGLLVTTKPLSPAGPLSLTVNSPVFAHHIIPPRFTCYGKGESPPIFWSGAPSGLTKSIAIVVDDSATPITPQVYWIVFDISPSTTDLQVDALPPHARVAQNSSGKAEYAAPCPVGAPHNYRFTVYALDAFLGRTLPDHATILQAWSTIAKHVIARGTMTAKACPNGVPARNTQCAP